MLGKEKCRILKEIRQRIADENDIPYVTRECGFQGECKGTCPRCESELRYLEKQLALRASLGKRVAVAALCASLGLGMTACSPSGGSSGGSHGHGLSWFGGGHGRGGEEQLMGMIAYVEPTETPEQDVEVETGEIAWPEETPDPDDVCGGLEPAETEPPYDGTELMGDVAWPEESDG